MISRLERLLFSLPRPLVNGYIRGKIMNKWGAKVGDGVNISRKAKIAYPENIQIGTNTFIGDCYLQAWASISIGNNVILSESARLLTGNHNLHSPNFEEKLLPITIEDYAWIATGAIILGGVTVGRGAVVGAGAVVREDVPQLGIVIGNPSKLVGFRRCSDFNYDPNRSI
jgi:acetyltransferase-like isoleucine patch superfamily enzyme